MLERGWDPDLYERFSEERRQPFFDLLAYVAARPGMKVVDLGCGTGGATRRLHDALRAVDTVGVDSSAEMLARCEGQVAPGLRFEWGDLAAWDMRDRDLVFANASLQWVDDHPALLTRIAAQQAEGAQLAFQVPASYDHPSHHAAWEVASELPFWEALGGDLRAVSVLRPDEYSYLLHELGYREQHVRLQVYGHVLPDREAVVDWVSGTLLTYFRARLSPGRYAEFLARYRERLFQLIPDARPFFYPFKRILVWARK